MFQECPEAVFTVNPECSVCVVYSPVQLPVVRTEDWENLASDPQMSRDEDRCSMEELIRILLSSGISKL